MAPGGGLERTDEQAYSAPRVAQGDIILAVGNGTCLSHTVVRSEVAIGRDSGCDFVIAHPSLSRRHAVLRVDSTLTVQDLGSTNGTQVDGRVVRGGEPVAVDPTTGFSILPYMFVVIPCAAESDRPRAGGSPLRIDDPTVHGASSLVRQFAQTDVNVLIVGETGVGKEVLASSVHELSGRRGPFIQLNCAALSETLLESELFGHERGAFTGAIAAKTGLIEAAAGGTFMLDELGELPLGTQAKLLRAVERREVLRLGATRPVAVDVRVIAATNRDLTAEVARGAFRADLFYRLDGVTIAIAPLRERHGAILPLALSFIEAARMRTPGPTQLSSDAAKALEAHAWPGNVRELKAVIQRAVVLAGPAEISAAHLMFAPSSGIARVSSGSFDVPAHDEDRARVIDALERCAGNQTRAARLLGISRTTMITKLRIYKIPRPTER